MSVVPFLEAARINIGRHPAVVPYHLVADTEASPHVPGADRNFSALSRATGRQGRQRARVALRHRLRSKAETVHDAWTEVLEDHIGAVDQTLRCREVASVL